MRDDIIEACALAMEAAKCSGRQGPFGGFDYGHNNPKPVEGGRYVIRDFRDPASENWGKWIHQTDDQDAHDAMFAQMTRQHIARAVLTTFKQLTAEPTADAAQKVAIKAFQGGKVYQLVHDEIFREIGI